MAIIRSMFLFVLVLLFILPAGCTKRHARHQTGEGERSGRIRLLNETRDIDVYSGSCDLFARRTVSLSTVLSSLAADKSLAYDKVTVCGGYHVYYVKGHGINGWVKGSKTADTIATVKSAVPRSQFIEVASDLRVVRESAPEPPPDAGPVTDTEPAPPARPVADTKPAPQTMTETNIGPAPEPMPARGIEAESAASGSAPLEETLEEPLEGPDVQSTAPVVAPSAQMPPEEVEIMTERDYEKEIELELQREKQKKKELGSQLPK